MSFFEHRCLRSFRTSRSAAPFSVGSRSACQINDRRAGLVAAHDSAWHSLPTREGGALSWCGRQCVERCLLQDQEAGGGRSGAGGRHSVGKVAGDAPAFNLPSPRLLYRQKLSSLCLDTRYNVRRLGSTRVCRGSRDSHLWSRRRHLKGLAMAAIVLVFQSPGQGSELASRMALAAATPSNNLTSTAAFDASTSNANSNPADDN